MYQRGKESFIKSMYFRFGKIESFETFIKKYPKGQEFASKKEVAIRWSTHKAWEIPFLSRLPIRYSH